MERAEDALVHVRIDVSDVETEAEELRLHGQFLIGSVDYEIIVAAAVGIRDFSFDDTALNTSLYLVRSQKCILGSVFQQSQVIRSQP